MANEKSGEPTANASRTATDSTATSTVTTASAPAPKPAPKPASKLSSAALKKGGFMAQRQKGYYSLRIRVVGGDLTSEQFQAVARVAEKYGHGYAHLTSRQAIEIPHINVADADEVKAELARGGVEPGCCGARVRTVTACQGCRVCPSGNIDTYDIAKKLDERYYGRDLPGKFKFGVTGCQNNCLKAEENDLGIKGGRRVNWVADACIHCGICAKVCRFDAISDDGASIVVDYDKCASCGKCAQKCPVDSWESEPVYNLTFGGLFGNHITKGRSVLPPVTSTEQLFRVADATIQWFDDHAKAGDRFKFTLDREGWDGMIEAVRSAYDEPDTGEGEVVELRFTPEQAEPVPMDA